MNFKESMIKTMKNMGMFPSQAEAVINEYIEINKDDPMMDRWYDDVKDYPEPLQNAIWIGVKEHASKWIKINAPGAWFRPMFDHSYDELVEKMRLRS